MLRRLSVFGGVISTLICIVPGPPCLLPLKSTVTRVQCALDLTSVAALMGPTQMRPGRLPSGNVLPVASTYGDLKRPFPSNPTVPCSANPLPIPIALFGVG